MSEPHRPVPALIYTVVVLGLLIWGWDAVARGFAEANPARWIVAGDLFADGSRNEALGQVLGALPGSEAPRVLVLGSSQMIVVKREPRAGRSASVAGQLAEALRAAGRPTRIVDLSAGGQRVAESLAVFAEARERVNPRLVVLGVGLFSMRSLEIRSRLLEQTEHGPDILEAADEAPPLLRERLEPLLAPIRALRDERSSRTVQDRTDAWLASRLGPLAFVEHREAIFDQWIDRPIRQDLFTWFKRRAGAAATGTTARSYGITSAYEASIAAIELLSHLCESHGAQLVLVSLPFDGLAAPPVYTAEDQGRLEADLAGIAGAIFVDLSDALGPGNFGRFVDGSPDSVHFDRAGHRTVADALLPHVAGALAESGR